MNFWYKKHLLARFWHILLWPLAALYDRLMRLRYAYFRWQRPQPLPVPVIVIGNLSVGGSGKTPVVAALVKHFQQQGKKVGVVSRGYGRKSKAIIQVQQHHTCSDVGDEPRWLYWQTQAPVVVARKRRQAAEMLIKQGIELILADDGLQHYALPRTVEIALLGNDLGNRLPLPAGPLREGLWRLKTLDLRLGENKDHEQIDFTWKKLSPRVWPLAALWQTRESQSLADFATQQNAKAQKTVFALAGIARPERFFNTLCQAGLAILPLAFADHYPLTANELPDIAHGYPTLMTGKDAVRLLGQQAAMARDDIFFVDYWLALPEDFFKRLTFLLEQSHVR
jgi:tetraacyldisaccharide 4'-kinase